MPGPELATGTTTRDKLAKEAATLTVKQIAAIHQGLQLLAGMDEDFARELNNVGYSKIDARIGHELAEQHSLTAKQAALGKKVVMKYHRQLPNGLLEEMRGNA